MAGKYFGRVTDASGNPYAGASVSIYQKGTSNLASLTDDNGDPIANPLTADSGGEFSFNATEAQYDARATYYGQTVYDRTLIVASEG